MKKVLSKKWVIVIIFIILIVLFIVFGILYKEGYMLNKLSSRQNQAAQVSTGSIGVSLIENGKIVVNRDYTSNNELNESGVGVLLSNFSDEDIKVGKSYQEEIAVYNSGSIDTYVRVVITKDWKDTNGNKYTELDPDMIILDILEENGWIIDENAFTPERITAYYIYPIEPDEKTGNVINSIKINSDVQYEYNVIENGRNIEVKNKYDEYIASLSIEADAIQTHNAKDAILSAWGVNVNIASDGTLSLQ